MQRTDWRDRFIQRAMSVDSAFEQSYRYKGDEPGFTHPVTGASVRMRDDGCIDIFAGPMLGIRMDPNANSINLICEKLNIWSRTTSMHTDNDKFLWNYMPINPQIRQMQKAVDGDGWPYTGPYEGQRRYFTAVHEYEQYVCDEDGCRWEVVSPKYRPYLRDRSDSMIRAGRAQLQRVLKKFNLEA